MFSLILVIFLIGLEVTLKFEILDKLLVFMVVLHELGTPRGRVLKQDFWFSEKMESLSEFED